MVDVVDEVDFKKAYNDLSLEVKSELIDLRSLLLSFDKQHQGIVQVNDHDLMKRIARLCLLMMDQTPVDDKGIMETSYLITSYFFFNEYEDKMLNEALGIFAMLELPSGHVDGDVRELWTKAKALLEKVVSV